MSLYVCNKSFVFRPLEVFPARFVGEHHIVGHAELGERVELPVRFCSFEDTRA